MFHVATVVCIHYTVRGILEFISANFTEFWYPDLVANISGATTIRDIACVALKYILSAIHVRHTDIWVLDVEGAEEKALLGTGEDISVGN